jgi:non-specific serine/threonine protein kinase
MALTILIVSATGIKDKNKLLEAYGYSLADDLKGKFEFAYKDGKPFLRVLDAGIKRVAPLAVPHPARDHTAAKRKRNRVACYSPGRINDPCTAVRCCFQFQQKKLSWFTIDAVIGEPNDKNDGFAGNAEKPDISRILIRINYRG